MGRPRQYASNADRQRAYRHRNHPQQDVTIAALRDAVDGKDRLYLLRLRRVINDAIETDKAFERWRAGLAPDTI
jgi:hypothetical protein